ncbi:MAG: hypothetical protein HQM02_10465, partial [Magnetococcales bacterium]|nr:hypothetical protein [Magnetococcales bacterium]
AVQMPNGAVMGGTVEQPPTPAVFNTGQVILGWLRAHAETGGDKYLEAARRAGRFLVETQAPNGQWIKGNSRFADPASTTYNSRVGWALILLGEATHENLFTEAGERNIIFTLSRQQENGWFADNCLSDPKAPLLHTICYAIEGILGAARATGNADWQRRAMLPATRLLEALDSRGALPGRFDASWRGTVSWSCLTGNAQLAGICLTLYEESGLDRYREGAERLLAFLKRTQNCRSTVAGIRGGIKGSHPFDGAYGRFEILNWATKFFIDALIQAERISEAVNRTGGALPAGR